MCRPSCATARCTARYTPFTDPNRDSHNCGIGICAVLRYHLHQKWCTLTVPSLEEVLRSKFLLKGRNTSEQAFNREIEGADMVAELSFIEEWIPEQMEPGTLFVLESAGDMGEAQNPYWAVLACPSCGCLGLITRCQYAGLQSMICGAEICSAEYFLRDGEIGYRKPH